MSKNIKPIVILLSFYFSLDLLGQCSFQHISNDTLYQDYIEFIYPRQSKDEIITIGSRKTRGILNDSVFNASEFQVFDYCGNILTNTFYEYIGNCKLKHVSIPANNTYKEEPVGNTAVRIKENEFLLVDKAFDTLKKESVLILFNVNEKGELKSYSQLTIDIIQANQTVIKNVLKLKNGNILVILWDANYQYIFYYFDENSVFKYKKSFSLGRGIRSIVEVDNGEFICSSLAYDIYSFQFYRLDTLGEIKWITTPYNLFGASIREIQIVNNKLYITGATVLFGVFLICDLNGNIIKELKFDKYHCSPRFCSAYIDSDNSFFIGGYLEQCQSSDSSGTDIVIINIDSNGIILWDKLYDFRNALGTPGPQGKYTDYGGFVIDKANDGGIITNGMSKYNRTIPGGILHEDALLIKTQPIDLPNPSKEISEKSIDFSLYPNVITSDLTITGPVELIEDWKIFNMTGDLILHGDALKEPLCLSCCQSGLYIINFRLKNNSNFVFKFVKI